MQLIRRPEAWDPFRELDELSNRLQRWFGAGRSGDGEREMLATADWSPSCEIRETENEYHIRTELPNVKKDDVRVTLEGGILTIQGERKEEKEEKGVKYHRRELTYGSFVRRFAMPDDADESQIDATFKDGMLEIKIAKSKARPPKAREISLG